jgi:hypothetical protein
LTTILQRSTLAARLSKGFETFPSPNIASLCRMTVVVEEEEEKEEEEEEEEE